MKLISDGLKSDLYASVCSIVDDWVQRMQQSDQAEAAGLTPIFGRQHQAPPPFGRQAPPEWPSQIDILTANQRSTVLPSTTTTTTTTTPVSNLLAAPTATVSFGPPPPPTIGRSQRNSPMPIANTPNGPRSQFYFNPFYSNSFPYASAALNFVAAAAATAAASSHQAPPPNAFLSSPVVAGALFKSALTPASTIFPSFSSSTAGVANQQNQSPYMGLNLSHKTGNSRSINKSLDDQASTPKKRSKVPETRGTTSNVRGDDLGQLHAAVATAHHQLGVGVGGLLNLHHHQNPFNTEASNNLAASIGGGGGRGSSNFDDSDLQR